MNHSILTVVEPVATTKPRKQLGTKSRAVAKFLHPCSLRGDVIGSAICAEGCGKGSATKDVHACSLHGRCTVGVRAVGVDHCCRDCPDRTGKQSLQVGQATHPYSALLREAAESLPEYTGSHAGRGIVTVAGGSRYFTCVYVLISLLRKSHGCTLPIEVWHLDEGEMDSRMRELLLAFGGVRVVNAADVAASLPESERPKRLKGWECKAFAIQHSAFREVLFLDSDQLPARDPSDLFDLPQFAESGAVFWPDFEPEGWRVSAEAFRICGLPIPGKTRMKEWRHPTDYEAWETGQVLVDKSRHWKGLKLWQWFGDHAEFWYKGCATGKGVDLVYGDKDTAYLAWHVLGLPFAMPRKSSWLGKVYVSGCFVQYDFDGKPFFYHRVQPQTKFNLHGENERIPGCTVWDDTAAALEMLKAQWSGRPFDSYGEAPGVDISGVVGEWWYCHDEESAKTITLKANRTLAGLPEANYWSVREDARGPLLVLSDGTKATHFLGRDPHGNWINHGIGTFLVPAPPKGISIPRTRHDAVIANSVLRLNEYRYPERFDPGAVVLDIGAHCGLSVRAALDRGAAHVVAVEPAPGNLEYLRRNFGADPRVTILPVAAWTNGGTLRLSPGVVQCKPTDSSSGWTASDGGTLEVPCMVFADLLKVAASKSESGRVAWLKLDCEGAEWSILEGADLSGVDAVSCEYHGRGPDAAAALLPGFSVTAYPHAEAEGLGVIVGARGGLIASDGSR